MANSPMVKNKSSNVTPQSLPWLQFVSQSLAAAMVKTHPGHVIFRQLLYRVLRIYISILEWCFSGMLYSIIHFFLLKDFFFNFNACVHMCARVWAQLNEEARGGCQILWSWAFMEVWVFWHGCWKSNSVLCKTSKALTTAKSSLQPLVPHFKENCSQQKSKYRFRRADTYRHLYSVIVWTFQGCLRIWHSATCWEGWQLVPDSALASCVQGKHSPFRKWAPFDWNHV